MKIAEIIPTGRQNAVSVKSLMISTGWTERAVRAAVSRERISGALILSNRQNGGYYLPANRNELREFLRSNEAQVFSTLKMLRAAREQLKVLEGQLSLEL